MLRFQRSTKPAALVLALIWFGVLLGVSFIATPVKFTADSLSLPGALDVGQVTFHLFNKIEWVLVAVLGAFAVVGRRFRVVTGLLAAVLAAQTFWLLPTLDDRVSAIIGGREVPDAPFHWLYVGADLTKLTLLAIVASTILVHRRSGSGRETRHQNRLATSDDGLTTDG